MTDIMAFYDYGNNDTGSWVFKSNTSGFYAPTARWRSGAGNWAWSRSKLVSADFNGNGITDDGYVWSGAFSTETPTIYNGLPTHAYVSSKAARDALVLRLLATGQVQSISYVEMDNAVDTDDTTTGDHDGYAVVIVLK